MGSLAIFFQPACKLSGKALTDSSPCPRAPSTSTLHLVFICPPRFLSCLPHLGLLFLMLPHHTFQSVFCLTIPLKILPFQTFAAIQLPLTKQNKQTKHKHLSNKVLRKGEWKGPESLKTSKPAPLPFFLPGPPLLGLFYFQVCPISGLNPRSTSSISLFPCGPDGPFVLGRCELRTGITIKEWRRIDGQEVALLGRASFRVLRKKPGKTNTSSPFPVPGLPTPWGPTCGCGGLQRVSKGRPGPCCCTRVGIQSGDTTHQPRRCENLSPSFPRLTVITCDQGCGRSPQKQGGRQLQQRCPKEKKRKALVTKTRREGKEGKKQTKGLHPQML